MRARHIYHATASCLTLAATCTHVRSVSFVEWSKENGPFDTIVDGANVGMFKQNFENSEFNFNQVERLLAMLRNERDDATTPLLLVLHQRRVRTGPAKKPYAVRLIQSWQAGSACLHTLTCHASVAILF